MPGLEAHVTYMVIDTTGHAMIEMLIVDNN